MAASAATVLDPVLDLREPVTPRPPAFGDGPPRPPVALGAEEPPVSNARLGMLAFIVFESMLFAPLMGVYVLLRWGSVAWPPAGQPYLPIGITWVNTAFLLGSCVPLTLAVRAFRRGAWRAASRGLLTATTMGSVFLTIQGFEWARLVAHGLTVAKGVYGASFVILIGTHGIHVLGAVVWLATVTLLTVTGRIGAGRVVLLDLCAMYWYFVSALWVVLFALVYLA